jgi:hypothetical protein
MNQIRNDLKPMTVGDVLDYSVEAFKQNFKGLVLISLILYVPWIVFYSLTVNIFSGNQITELFNMYKDMFSSYMGDSYYIPPSSYSTTNIIVNLMAILQLFYSITIKLVLNAAVIKVIYDYAVSGNVEVNTFSDALKLIKGCFKFMPKLMGNAILFALIVLAAYFISALVGVLLIIFPIIGLTSMDLPNVVLAIIIVLLILIVIIGVLLCIGFFAAKLIFGANAIVIEGKSVAGSLSRSFYLTKGKFWHVVVACLFAILIYYLFNSLLVGATVLLSLVNKTVYIVINTFAQMSSALLEPFFLVFITIMFINLKIQKEGFDLEIKMRKMIAEEKVGINNDGETADA